MIPVGVVLTGPDLRSCGKMPCHDSSVREPAMRAAASAVAIQGEVVSLHGAGACVVQVDSGGNSNETATPPAPPAMETVTKTRRKALRTPLRMGGPGLARPGLTAQQLRVWLVSFTRAWNLLCAKCPGHRWQAYISGFLQGISL